MLGTIGANPCIRPCIPGQAQGPDPTICTERAHVTVGGSILNIGRI